MKIKSLNAPDTCHSLNQLMDCLHDIALWMKTFKLKLNADKTKFLALGTPMQRRKLDGFSQTHILSTTPATPVLYLGITFDENFNSKQHKLY